MLFFFLFFSLNIFLFNFVLLFLVGFDLFSIQGTHLDHKMCTNSYVEKKFAFLQERYCSVFPNIVATMAVSCETMVGIKDLIQKIIQVSLEKRQVGYSIPFRYLVFEDLLRSIRIAQNKNFLAWKEYKSLCLNAGLTKISSLTLFLCKVGVIVYFKKYQQRDTLVILVSISIKFYFLKKTKNNNFILNFFVLESTMVNRSICNHTNNKEYFCEEWNFIKTVLSFFFSSKHSTIFFFSFTNL
jgi:hypothetical protein